MKKTLSEWIEWAETATTHEEKREWVLVEYVQQVVGHEDAHRRITGQPTDYDQEITLVSPYSRSKSND